MHIHNYSLRMACTERRLCTEQHLCTEQRLVVPYYRRRCGTLKKVDLIFMNEMSSGANTLSVRSAHLQSTRDNSSQSVIDAQTDSSTCSCVEGNSCASNEHCYATVKQLIALGLAKKDPAVDPNMRVNISGRKEEVAKAARRKKGIRD